MFLLPVDTNPRHAHDPFVDWFIPALIGAQFTLIGSLNSTACPILLPPMMQRLGLTSPRVPDDHAEFSGRRRRRQNRGIPLALPFLDSSLKYFAYFGGPIMADMMIHGLASGRRPTSQDDVERWLDEHWGSYRRCGQAVCHQTLRDLTNLGEP